MKKNIAILFLLVFVSSVYAVTIYMSAFANQDNPFNISFTEHENITRYLQIPLSGYVENVSLILTARRWGNYSGIIDYDSFTRADGLPGQTELLGINYTALGNHANLTDNTLKINVTGVNQGDKWVYRISPDRTNYTVSWKVNGTEDKRFRLSTGDSTINDAACGYEIGANGFIWFYITVGGNKLSTNKTIINNTYLIYTIEHDVEGTQDNCTYTIQYENETKYVEILARASQNVDNLDTVRYYHNDGTIGGAYLDEWIVCDGLNSDCYWDWKDTPKYTRLTNPYIEIDDGNINYEWEYVGELVNESINVSINTSVINNILSDRCACDQCTINESNCMIPFIFHSDTASILELDLLIANYSFGVDNCTNSFDIPSNATSLNISFHDLDESPVNINQSSNIFYGYNNNNTFNYSFETEQISSYQYCIYPSWTNLTGDLNLQYFYLDSIFNYFTEGTVLDNTTNDLVLYVDTAETLTQVTAIVYDNINNRVEAAYIQAQRYDFGTGTYKLVSEATTNFEGEAQLYLTLNSVYYKFLIYYPISTLRKTTNPTYIYSTSIEFHIDLYDDWMDKYFQSSGVTYTLDFNNATNNFRFIYNDPSANIGGGALKVYRITAKEDILLNETYLYTTSGTILINVPKVNDTLYIAKAYVIINNDDFFLDSLSQMFFGVSITSFMGLLGVFLLTIVFAFILRFSIPLGIILIPLPTLLASSIGLISIDIMIALGLEISAVVLAIFINDRK